MWLKDQRKYVDVIGRFKKQADGKFKEELFEIVIDTSGYLGGFVTIQVECLI